MRPELWNVFLEKLSALSGVTKAALLTHNVPKSDHRMLATLGDGINDNENVRLYEALYYQFDEWTLRFPRNGLAGRVIRGEEIWPEDSLYKSTFYNEFLRTVDVCQMACIASTPSVGALETLSIYRGPHDNSFGTEVFDTLKILAPHLRAALNMRRMLVKLESRVSDLENAVDVIVTGLVLLDAKGKCVLANNSARTVLDRRDGLFLDRGFLSTSNSTESTRLRELILSAISTVETIDNQLSRAMVISRTQGMPLQIMVAPLSRENISTSGRAVAIVFIRDPEEQNGTPSEVFQMLFGLTRAEARLAIALLDGRSLSETAEIHGVSLETVRSQIKSIFQKTGTKRQAELVRILARVGSLRA
jgi:DNA-binding CsgD family transcriptional regulator